MRIRLTKDNVDQCRDFADMSAPNQQAVEFQELGRRRAVHEIARDIFVGKLTEVAYAQVLGELTDLAIELDFNVYPPGVWDNQDICVNRWRLESKGIRGGNWLLVHWNSLRYRQREDALPHVYLLGIVSWNRDRDDLSPNPYVLCVGYATLVELIEGYPGTQILLQNQHIPHTNMPLQTHNFGRHRDDLHNDWPQLVTLLTQSEPFRTDNYYVPIEDDAIRIRRG